MHLLKIMIIISILPITSCSITDNNHQTEKIKFIKNNRAIILNKRTNIKNEKEIIMNKKDSKIYTNKLVDESSPYLQQHAHNPVNWYPWGDEALEIAKRENKLILVSIGYAACHWCHVMEHESFENEEVAKFMNEHFISIKVDREERPDIDQVYMSAVQLISGRGGWPLNCIALPDGRPIYGGTYFPKEQWLNMLSEVYSFAKNSPAKAEEQATALTEGINKSDVFSRSGSTSKFSTDDLDRIFTNWKTDIDFVEGGHKRAPKFPLPIGYQFLLNYYDYSNSKEALTATTLTLDKIAYSGLYDQVGGGFSRYSTDSLWRVPHFEKMLYDNGQLISLYAKAYSLTKKDIYKDIINESLEFINRELTDSSGAFYSSLDADSDGEEGKYYVWTKKELLEILGEDVEIVSSYYNVTDKGNWENSKNIFYKLESDPKFALKQKITVDSLKSIINGSKSKLLNYRDKRVKPPLDDKILTSWNGLMLKGYVDAYFALGDENYLNSAIKNGDFIIKNVLKKDGSLYRNFKNGKASINGFLDDYAFTIDGFISLYRATFNEKWLDEANRLTNFTKAHFFDSTTGLFFYTSNTDSKLVARKTEITDNVIPSSNSQMAKNLITLGHYFGNDDNISIAKRMVNVVKDDAIKGGSYYGNWDILLLWLSTDIFDVSIVGKDALVLSKDLNSRYLPNVILSGGVNQGNLKINEYKYRENETNIYICIGKSCSEPLKTVKDAINFIKSTGK